MLEPKLLLADEPTGNLDSHTGQAIHDLFFDLNRRHGTTMILVTHNEELAVRILRRMRMLDGALHEAEAAARADAP